MNREIEMDKAIRRWPRLTAHLICESLGYFTPRGAANAIAHYKNDQSFSCEWYSHMASFSGDPFDQEALKEIGADVMRWTVQRRHNHTGYMADYKHAKELVRRSLSKEGDPTFASWF